MGIWHLLEKVNASWTCMKTYFLVDAAIQGKINNTFTLPYLTVATNTKTYYQSK